ncbi:MAG: hypothetical protein IJ003_06110 [Candidatus Gastranaerophilales bacterium]|nr:hypothetical protein [Candidatus Gastranaerophilales bacterium]
MEKKILKYSFIGLCLVSCVLLFGCANNQIQFKRDSKVTELMNSLNINNTSKNQVKKSSGMIIYRDTSSSSSNSMNFGPRDINFDMSMRMK